MGPTLPSSQAKSAISNSSGSSAIGVGGSSSSSISSGISTDKGTLEGGEMKWVPPTKTDGSLTWKTSLNAKYGY